MSDVIALIAVFNTPALLEIMPHAQALCTHRPVALYTFAHHAMLYALSKNEYILVTLCTFWNLNRVAVLAIVSAAHVRCVSF